MFSGIPVQADTAKSSDTKGIIFFMKERFGGYIFSKDRNSFHFRYIFSETLRIRTEIESYDVHHRVTLSFEFTTDYTD